MTWIKGPTDIQFSGGCLACGSEQGAPFTFSFDGFRAGVSYPLCRSCAQKIEIRDLRAGIERLLKGLVRAYDTEDRHHAGGYSPRSTPRWSHSPVWDQPDPDEMSSP